jgi:hypothetical protein
MADIIEFQYAQQCATPSDINEHLPTLKSYAKQCQMIAEFGVRGVVSTWALLAGLSASTEPGPKRLDCIDIVPVSLAAAAAAGEAAQVTVVFQQVDSAKASLPSGVDMLFIDTWHVYGHLKRELAAHHAHVRKYIAMHDTTVDAIVGETIRCYGVAAVPHQAAQAGYTISEVATGLQPAIDEFLADHPEWVIDRVDTNNNGLTVLKRISQTMC